MEEEDNIIVKWAQEDVETSYNLLNNNNNNNNILYYILYTLPPSCAVCVEIPGTSTCWNPEGLSRPVQGLRNFECHTERLGEVQKLRNVQCSAVLLKIPCMTIEIRATRQNVRTQSIS